MNIPKNPTPRILIVDSLDPESLAMLQAFYSRSHKSITERLDELKVPYISLDEDGQMTMHNQSMSGREESSSGNVKNALKKFYLNYGHKSIGDCGTTAIFIEGVSMLAAKAIQDNPLYNGQESSTRYINFSEQPIVNPYMDMWEYRIAEDIQREWISIYEEVKDVCFRAIKLSAEVESGAGEDDTLDRAINAKAFDIARGFIPCGATTQLSWSGTLRSISDHLEILAVHPLHEIRTLAHRLILGLGQAYPSAFPATVEELIGDNVDLHMVNASMAYFNAEGYKGRADEYHVSVMEPMREVEASPALVSALTGSGSKKFHARALDGYRMSLSTYIDFASFRDIQRHRALNIPMPLVEAVAPWEANQQSNPLKMLNPFYLEATRQCYSVLTGENTTNPDNRWADKWNKLQDRIKKNLDAIKSMKYSENTTKYKQQYLIPMAVQVPLKIQGSAAAWIYMLKLRSSETVHFTLRRICQRAIINLAAPKGGGIISKICHKLIYRYNLPYQIEVPNFYNEVKDEIESVFLKRGNATIIDSSTGKSID